MSGLRYCIARILQISSKNQGSCLFLDQSQRILLLSLVPPSILRDWFAPSVDTGGHTNVVVAPCLIAVSTAKEFIPKPVAKRECYDDLSKTSCVCTYKYLCSEQTRATDALVLNMCYNHYNTPRYKHLYQWGLRSFSLFQVYLDISRHQSPLVGMLWRQGGV